MVTDSMNEDEMDSIRFENEFLKARIMAEFGAKAIYINPELDLPPEIENEFLKCIINKEEDANDTEQVPIYDYIGRPQFVPEQNLSDDCLPAELERILELLCQENIICDTIYPLDDRVFYKFLTEELFQQLIWDIHDSEVGTHYFYETFHPNHTGATKEVCEEFLNVFFDDNFQILISEYTPEEIRNYTELSEFRDCFNGFSNFEFEILDSDVNLDRGTCTAFVRFDGITDQGMPPVHHEGHVKFELNYIDDMWVVIRATFPGMPDC